MTDLSTTRDVLRALFLSLQALEQRGSSKRPKGVGPPNAGRPWSSHDHDRLLRLFDEGVSAKDLANQFGRSHWRSLPDSSNMAGWSRVRSWVLPNAAPRPAKPADQIG